MEEKMAKKVNRRAMKTWEVWHDIKNPVWGKPCSKYLGKISARSEYEAKCLADEEFEWDRSNPTFLVKRYPDTIRVKQTRF